MRPIVSSLPLFVLIAASVACSSADGPAPTDGPGLDGEHDNFGIGKADGPGGGYDACRLRESLSVVNDGTTLAFLKDTVKLHSRAAENILKHRLGPDGECGTDDDDTFDDLAELDAVPWVGKKALDALAAYVEPRCTVDLSTGRPFISQSTWAGQPNTSWARDEIEMEATMTASGISGAKLRGVLNATDNRGRTGFSRVRRMKIMEAFSLGYSLDEIPWDSDSHAARESLPYVAYTIESGNFEPDPEDGTRELSVGTDIMDDAYFDTKDYDLLGGGMQVRARVRWDNDDVVRRLLIAAKFDSETDEFGIKRAGKIDVRTDSANPEQVKSLEDDVRWGRVSWSQGLVPVKAVYEKLDQLGKLPDIDGNQKVLAMDAKVYLRSVRSRFHLNMVGTNKLVEVYGNGKTRAAQAKTTLEKAIASGKLSGAALTDAQFALSATQAVLDDSAVYLKAKPELEALYGAPVSQADVVMPSAFPNSTPNDAKGLKAREIVANAANAVYHDLRAQLDDVDRSVTFTSGLDHEAFVEMFTLWVKSEKTSLRAKTTADAFKAEFDAISALSASERQAKWSAFDTFGAAQRAAGEDEFDDHEPMTEAIWSALGAHLEFAQLKNSQYMLETAGSTALALYFDAAREHFMPSTSRPSGNFIIDTMDYTDMATPAAWATLSDEQKKPANALPGCKVFHTMLVNEVQIELTSIGQFTDAIDELKKQSDAAGGQDPAIEEKLNGALWVLTQMTDSMAKLGQLKEEGVIDTLRDFGAPSSVKWVPSTDSKGNTALKIITDTD